MSRGVTLATSLKSDAIEMMQPVERPHINFSTSKNCIYDSDGRGHSSMSPPLATRLTITYQLRDNSHRHFYYETMHTNRPTKRQWS